MADGKAKTHSTPRSPAARAQPTKTLHSAAAGTASESVSALLEIDHLLHDILDHSAAIVFVKDMAGRYIFANRHWETVFGVNLDCVLGRSDDEIFGPDVGRVLRANDLQVLERGAPLEVEEVVPSGGQNHTYIVVKNPLRDENGEIYALCGVATDITEQARVSEKLRESESRYRLLAEYSYDLITRHGPDGKYLYVSPACQTLLGFTPEELLGRDAFELLHPDDLEAARRHHQAQLQGRDDERTLTCRIRRKDGSYLWVESLVHVIRDSQTGEIAEIVATTRDVTERKRAETAAWNSARLASIGTLAAGIAHEINNPIGAAWTSAEAALAVKDDPDAGPLLEECLQNVIQSVRRCGEIVRSVLRFSRHEALEKPPNDLNAIVGRAFDACRTYAESHGAKLEMDLAEDLPPAPLNSLEIEQVVVNLVRNSIESGEKVRVVIHTAHDSAGVWLQVSDNGHGLSTAECERIFEPFYTLRERQGGTGLGLSIVYGIVQEHGGDIRVESELGKGTQLSIYFPFAPGAVDDSRQVLKIVGSTQR